MCAHVNRSVFLCALVRPVKFQDVKQLSVARESVAKRESHYLITSKCIRRRAQVAEVTCVLVALRRGGYSTLVGPDAYFIVTVILVDTANLFLFMYMDEKNAKHSRGLLMITGRKRRPYAY